MVPLSVEVKESRSMIVAVGTLTENSSFRSENQAGPSWRTESEAAFL